jgi:dihydroorotate dehydrogenase electron transfer subunit
LSRLFKAEIAENRRLTKDCFLLKLNYSGPVALPGQFIMIRVSPSSDPLLRRPFSVLGCGDGRMEILFRKRGKGTALISLMKAGEEIEAIGPLGNFFPAHPEDHMPLIVAGGIGIAGAFSLIERLSGKAHVFYGVRTKDELVLQEEIKRHAGREALYITTEDGSYKTKGTVMDSLNGFLNVREKDKFIVYSCGPKGMLCAVSEFALKKGIRGYVSLEENMACGFGVCLGCAVKTKGGFKRVCREGPVFDMDEVIWQT